MKKNYVISVALLAALTACSMMPRNGWGHRRGYDPYAVNESVEESSSQESVPEHYSKIEFPEYKYVAPYPKDYRVQIADGITGYIVSDSTLPLVDFSVYFEESHVPQV